MTDLSTEEVGGIVKFLGYGRPARTVERPSAPVWFIGFEEGLGGMKEEEGILENLKARAGVEKTMDLYEAHLLLKIDFKTKLPSTKVWQWMAKIMRARDGHKDWKDLKAAKEYIGCRLGRCDGDTFLTELCPVPASKATDKTLKTLLSERDPDLDSKIELRKKELKKTLNDSCPSLVICYGKTRADEFEELLEIKWHAVTSKISKSQNAKHLLLPFFRNDLMGHSVIEDLLHSGLL
jgi:hypothetical protein